MPTTPVLAPITYWSNGSGIIHQIRRVSYVNDPKNAMPAYGTRTLCGQEVAYLHPSFLGEGKPCKVCEAGGTNEIALIHSLLGIRWLLPGQPLVKTIELGPITITAYESENRPGGWTIDIDAPSGTDLLVAINDGDVYNDVIPD